MPVIHKKSIVSFFLMIIQMHAAETCSAQSFITKNDVAGKTITFGNSKLAFTIDYDRKVNISSLDINGQNVIKGNAGIYSMIKTHASTYSSLALMSEPVARISGNIVEIGNITYGEKDIPVREIWRFTVTATEIKFIIERNMPKAVEVEEASLPQINFNSIHTWEGAYQGYGGLAWFYLFNEKLATYGVHTNSSRFWNSMTGNGLKVLVNDQGGEVAMKYSRTKEDRLSYAITVSGTEMQPRFDSGTNRRRFLRQRDDVWAPFTMAAGKTVQDITLSYFDFNAEYGRGKFVGLDGGKISAVLNTIARIGVIDKQHFGGNSWHTPYGPICLHEQYIAEMGLAINDDSYLQGYRDCLDFYRDNAIKPDGRVWPRWAYNNVDIMKGQVTKDGFYEAQWGYLLDSNPDLVTNVSELYDQTGDKAWVKTHQVSCERALDWLINRDNNHNGLVEMMTDSYRDRRGSDWIDIIWAAYENAFVNAKLYYALTKWSDIERQLGNMAKAISYETFAARLKKSFNRSTKDGGFWDDENKCYVHWLDKDRSVHGRGMVTPVNFMAIAYGICDDAERQKTILDAIEFQMQKEKLMFWPLTMNSYAPGEGNDWQFPFPAYENGDIFLSWGAVAVKAYAGYKPEVALKYVRNVMNQHSIDGLAFQRYGREKQNGLGDDVLSGNSLSVVGLYHSIYGINPLYNRFYLDPHLTPELAGTELNYHYRGRELKIGLAMNRYSVADAKFKIISAGNFGFYDAGSELSFFAGSSPKSSMQVKTGHTLTLDIASWDNIKMSWLQTSDGDRGKELAYKVNQLTPGAYYVVTINSKNKYRLQAGRSGSLTFNSTPQKSTDSISISKVIKS